MKSLITNLKPGTIIRGKWHNNTYQIVRRLGSGAIGVVYLALNQKKYVAIKISEQSSSITTEVNVLKAFGKVQGVHLGPSLLDVDDWAPAKNQWYSFYVMEYLQGMELNVFLKQKGAEWLSILLIHLLDDLAHLHKEGWVFGDLKPENLIVTKAPHKLRWIDVGGTTQQGRSIKEFTEFYDRGYWGLGSRKADPSYDLFAVAMIMVQVYYPNRFERGPYPKATLKHKINQHPQLRKFSNVLFNALQGKYTTSKEMKNDLTKLLLYRTTKNPKPNTSIKSRQMKKQPITKRTPPHSKWIESLGIAMVTALFFMIFLFFQMF